MSVTVPGTIIVDSERVVGVNFDRKIKGDTYINELFKKSSNKTNSLPRIVLSS